MATTEKQNKMKTKQEFEENLIVLRLSVVLCRGRAKSLTAVILKGLEWKQAEEKFTVKQIAVDKSSSFQGR